MQTGSLFTRIVFEKLLFSSFLKNRKKWDNRIKLDKGVKLFCPRIYTPQCISFVITVAMVASRLRAVTQKRNQGRFPVTHGYVSWLHNSVASYEWLR